MEEQCCAHIAVAQAMRRRTASRSSAFQSGGQNAIVKEIMVVAEEPEAEDVINLVLMPPRVQQGEVCRLLHLSSGRR